MKHVKSKYRQKTPRTAPAGGASRAPGGRGGQKAQANAAAGSRLGLRLLVLRRWAWRMRPGRPHDHARGSGPARCRTQSVAGLDRRPGSGIGDRASRPSVVCPWTGQRSPPASRHPRVPQTPEEAGGVSQGDEVSKSGPVGPSAGRPAPRVPGLRFRSAVCVSTAVAETRPTRPRIRPRLRERGNAAPRRGTRLYY